MKKNKIIGIAVATLGVVVSMTVASALYIKTANNGSFGISQGQYTGSEGAVTYKINGNTSGNIAPQYWKDAAESENGKTGTGLGGDYTQVVYEMTLSATFAEGLNEQPYVVGNLSVSITDIPAAYQGKMSIWVDIAGYEGNTLGDHDFKNAFMTSDYAITSSATEYVADRNVAVAASGVQTLRIMLKYDLNQIGDLLTQNEAGLGYSLSVSWGRATSAFKFAYVVGNGNQWTDDDEYAMAPNINKAYSEGYEWVYYNLPGTLGEAKCHGGNKEAWSSGNNYACDSSKSYTVYWNGESSGAASFSENH